MAASTPRIPYFLSHVQLEREGIFVPGILAIALRFTLVRSAWVTHPLLASHCGQEIGIINANLPVYATSWRVPFEKKKAGSASLESHRFLSAGWEWGVPGESPDTWPLL